MGGGLDAMWQRISVLCTLPSPRRWFHSFFPASDGSMILPSLSTTSIFTSFVKHTVSPFLKTRLKKTHFIPHTRCIFILHLPLLAKLVRKVYTGVSDSILGCSFTSKGFPGDSEGKESARNAGDPGLIPGSQRPPGEENGNPLWYSCLENPMDRGAWRATHGVAKSQTWLSD